MTTASPIAARATCIARGLRVNTEFICESLSLLSSHDLHRIDTDNCKPCRQTGFSETERLDHVSLDLVVAGHGVDLRATLFETGQVGRPMPKNVRRNSDLDRGTASELAPRALGAERPPL